MSESGRSNGKKLMNSVESCVDDGLSGLVAINDQLRLITEHRIVVRSDYEQVKASRRVTLLSGGGSGHEPTFPGFVGKGLMTAAVAGSVFASPPASNILAALRLLGNGNDAGTLIIVANYTGDRLNFGLAAERAKGEGHRVELLLVADDCALVSANKAVGKRGLCGIVLAMKIAGAMAEDGLELNEIVLKMNDVLTNLHTIGMSLSPCSVPGCRPTFALEADEMELGLGVHGEAGVSRLKLTSSKEAVDIMFNHMTSSENVSLNKGDKVILLVNNLGGTSQLEMNIVARDAIRWLGETVYERNYCARPSRKVRDVDVERVFIGPLMSSLEMAGFSLTVLVVVNDTIVSLVDAETTAPGWPSSYQRTVRTDRNRRTEATLLSGNKLRLNDGIRNEDEIGFLLDENDASIFRSILKEACDSIIEARDLINDLDCGCGDGDCGSTLSCGSQHLLELLEKENIDVRHPSKALSQLSDVCQEEMGGSSGALYGIFFAAASMAVREGGGLECWQRALSLGVEAIAKYGGAEPGDRTMLDALVAAVDAFDECGLRSSFEVAAVVAKAAKEAAERTTKMEAKAGRASYVSSAYWTKPDPGATAVAIILEAISRVLNH